MAASVTAVLVGAFGSLVGSFLNVIIFRVPAGKSIVSPPSACPSCGARIKAFDNIPAISWLVLRGRCRDCRVSISVRYPLVELGTALFFGIVTLRFWPGGFSTVAAPSVHGVASTLVLIAFLYFAAVSVALALIDLDTHTLPNRIVLPSYIVGFILVGIAAVLDTDYGALLRAVIGSAALVFAYAALAFAYPGGMGFGDVKLAGVIGLFLGYLGWRQLVVGAFGAFLLGGLFSLILLALRRADRKSGIPFGPWMLAGGWAGTLAGTSISSGYLALFGLA